MKKINRCRFDVIGEIDERRKKNCTSVNKHNGLSTKNEDDALIGRAFLTYRIHISHLCRV